MRLSVLVEGAHGLTWPRWKEFIREVERMGFTGLYGSDHFTLAAAPPDKDSLELIVSLTYAADHSERLTLGQLVSPVSFRDPVMLTRQMLALDDLSGGRMVFGVGAGWNVREHAMFGYRLGEIKTRMDRFAESLEVITLLMRSDGPVSLLRHLLSPRRSDGAATPATAWWPAAADRWRRPEAHASPRRALRGHLERRDDYPGSLREKLALLDALIVAAGRQPGDVARTLMTPVYCGRSTAELAQRASGRRATPALTDLSDEDLVEQQRGRGAIMGTPDEVVERIRVYEALGIEEIMVQWFALDDLDGLREIAEYVLPRVGG